MTKKLHAVPVLFLFCLFGTSSARSQETVYGPLASNDADIPNAPSSTQETTCTENNGKPCPEWVHKWIGQYPPLRESGKTQPPRDPSSVHFWTYRGWEEPPLRTNKEVFRSKLFLATHLGGAIAMGVASHTRNSGQTWGQGVPAVAVIFGMDYLQFRYVGGPNAIAPPVYEMVHYGLASTK